MSDSGKVVDLAEERQAHANDKLTSQIASIFQENIAKQQKQKELNDGEALKDGDAYFFDEEGVLCMRAGNFLALIEQYELMEGQTILDDSGKADLTSLSNANPEHPVHPEHVVELIRQMTSNPKFANEAEAQHTNGPSDGESDSSSEGGIIEDSCIQPAPWERSGKSSDPVDGDHTISRRDESVLNPEEIRRRTPRKSKSRTRKGSTGPTGNDSSMISNSSFRKPLPPAVALRKKMRRLSEAEANASYGVGYEDEEGQSTDSVQISNMPDSPPAYIGESLPRSISYPNTSTPGGRSMRNADLKNRIAEKEFRMGLSNDSFEDSFVSPLGVASKALMSPSFSEHSFNSLALKSPTYGATTRGNELNWQSPRDTDVGDSTSANDEERIAALEAEVENLKRTINEKKRTIENLQRDIDETTSRLQKEVDDLQSDLSLKRKEDALNKVRENGHLATIGDLEAELTKESKELEELRTQHAKLRTDNDQLASTLETESTNGHEQRSTIKHLTADKTAFIAKEKQWELQRQEMQEQVGQLQSEIISLQKELEDRESDKRTIEYLQNNVDQLTAELNDVRNQGSNFLNTSAPNSRQNTLGRSLNQDLAKQIRQEREEQAIRAAAKARAAAAAASAPASTLDEHLGDPADTSLVEPDTSVDSETGKIMLALQKGEISLSDHLEVPPVDGLPQTETEPIFGDGLPRAERESVFGDSLPQLERKPVHGDESGTVVEVGESSLQKNEEPGTLPTYDEAEVTKAVMERMHPRWNANSRHELQFELKGKAAKAYLHFAQNVGTRCREIEERLENFTEPEPEPEPEPEVEKVRVEKGHLSDHLTKLVDAFAEGFRSSNLSGWLLVGIILSWATLVILLKMKYELRNKAIEEADSWRISNTLQVPWSIAGNFEPPPFDKVPFSLSWSERIFGKQLTPQVPI
ncbi:uncharacterized protein FA14DRAFT_160247 [Meira miltonrushii]|uniref:Uncharacterized protein n=1 Tax=Meira miltonrushii TaxID=1280837 RepID=A0A316VH21_9BASI|nr:uncharacterized protein FA14DRAFT_160247 [Meira miltonrushii]PWN34805.1 hypothetical protein FA14DRAFT_160247 [Meira miltonrushii]